MWKIIIRSGHNLSHNMVSQLWWYMQNYGMIGLLKTEQEQGQFLQDFNYELVNSLRPSDAHMPR